MKIENIFISNIDVNNGTATLTFDIIEITNNVNVDLKIDDGEFTQILDNQEEGTITYDLTNIPRGIHDLVLKISNEEEEEYISEPFSVKFKVNPTIEGLECTYSDSTGKFILKFTILGDELFTYNVNFKLDENEYQEIMTSQIIGEKTFESISEMGSHTCILKISDGHDEYQTDIYSFDITNQKPILSKVLAKDISNDGSANIYYGVKDIENSTLTHYLNIDGTNKTINPTRLNSFYTYKISGLSVGNHTCFISVTDGIDTVTTDEVNIEIFANSTDKKEILRQSKARYDFAYQSLKDIITSVVSDSVFDYDIENEIIQKAQESYNETYSEFNRIAQQSIDIIGTNKVNLTKEDLTSQINDVDNALNSLETTMEGVFRDGLLSDSEKILLSDNLNIIAKEKVDVDRDYETLYNNEDLLDPAKSKLQTNYNAFVVAQNSLATLIDNIIKKDSIIDNEDKANIDSAFEAWRNALGNYRNASLEAIDSIAKKKADDSSDIVNERWAEIILDPESGIQSQVGQLYDKVSGTGGIEQRLTTAEQTITTEGITNLIKDTYYSKEEIDETIEDIRDDIHVAVASVDVQYYLSTSQTSLVGGSWSSVAPTWVNGKYMWSKTVTTLTDGTVSESAPTCIAGAKGDSASPNYTWIRYADDANGNGISNSPEGKDYIGFAYNKTTSTESNTPSDYVWSLIKGKDGTDGTDGTNGINGTNGKDGTTYYTWIKYSNSFDGSNMYDTPNADTLYIGIATNQTSITESTDKTKYTWSKFRGDDGVDGTDGKDGTEIVSITEEYYLSTSKTTQTGGSWVTTQPQWSNGKYLWTRSKIVYKNPSSTTYTTPVCDSSYDAINDVSVGGTNLLLDTKTLNNWSYNGYTLQKDKYDGTLNAVYIKYIATSGGSSYKDFTRSNAVWVEPNTEYTLSFWAKGTGKFYSYLYYSGKSVVASGYNSSGAKTTASDGAIITTLSNSSTWKRYWITWKTNSTINQKVNIIPSRVYDGLGDCELIICGVKFEKGNKATDWSPAPEDVQEQIDKNKVEIETTKDTVASHTTSLSNITSRVSTTESQITTINGNITSMNSRINTAEQKITDSAIINTVSSTIDNKVNAGISGIQGQVDEIKTDISTIEQTTQSIQSTVASHTGSISTLTQRADSFDVTIAGKADSSNIISKINASTEGITISSSKVNITGFVTFNDLSTSGKTTINGSNITTGYISANRISGGTIDASKITVTNLNASNITSGTISGDRIKGGTISATDEINFVGGARIFGNEGEYNSGLSISAGGITLSGGTVNYLYGSWYLPTGNLAIEDGDLKLSSGCKIDCYAIDATSISCSSVYCSSVSSSGNISTSGNLSCTSGTIYGTNNLALARGTLWTSVGSATRDYLRFGTHILSSDSSYGVLLTDTGGSWATLRCGSVIANGTTLSSDIRLKTDIKYVNLDTQSIEESGLTSPNVNLTTEDMHSFIETLPMASYRLKNDVENGIDKTYYGFIAQDILYTKVGSELVEYDVVEVTPPTKDEEGNVIEEGVYDDKGLKYSENKFIAFVCGALQEEIKQRKALEQEVISLKEIIEKGE